MSETTAERIERELEGVLARPGLPRSRVVAPWVLTEADHLARYFEAHFEPVAAGPDARPGLRDAELPPHFAADIDYLVAQVKASTVPSLAPADVGFPTERVRALIGELQALLRWKGTRDPVVETLLANLRRRHARARVAADWVLALSEYLLAARRDGDPPRVPPAFDPGLFAEADALVEAHRSRGLPARTPEKRRAALAVLLRERMRDVVGAADLVFRNHPELARKARSERLLRRQAAAARARRRKAAAQPATPVEPA